MGYSTYIYAGVGVKIDLTKIEFEEPEANCDHFARHGNKFCPKCGKPVIDEEIDLGRDISAIADLYGEEARSRGLLFESMDYDSEDPAHIYFLGRGVTAHDNGGGPDQQFMEFPKEADVLLDIKRVHESITAWLRIQWADDGIDLNGLSSQFGFHLFTHASY